MTLREFFFQTTNSVVGLIARVTLGVVILPHGLQKSLGMFDGLGFSGSMDYFVNSKGLPASIGFLVIAGESLGALTLIAGFFTRFAALSICTILAGAIVIVHFKYGFLMNWWGIGGKGEGYEFHLLGIALGVIAAIVGGGKWSVDKLIYDKFIAPHSRAQREKLPI